MVLYVDAILFIGNNVCAMSTTKVWLTKQFNMKDLSKENYVFRIQIIRERKNMLIALSQTSHVNKILSRFNMQDSKERFLPFRLGVKIVKEQSTKNT